MKKTLWIVLGLACALSLYPAVNYYRSDLETEELNVVTRRRAPGQFVTLSDGMVHYQLAGPPNGKPVVLVHGFSVPYYLWDPTFEALTKAGYRVLRYDLYGRGYSDRPDVKYDGALYDRQLTELLAAVNVKGPVDLIGASMGGPIVATFACRHPERTRYTAFFDPGYSKPQFMPFRLRAPILGEYNMAVNLAPGLAQSQTADFLHPDRHADWPERYKPQMRFKGFRRAILSTLRDYVTTDWTQDYACFGQRKTPVLLVWGKADRDIPFATSAKVLAAIPHAKFLPVEDAAHVPFIEHPELVNPVLLDFLAQ